MQRTIHIVTNRPGPLQEMYLLSKLAWHWERAGHTVKVGPADTVSDHVDLAIMHIDQTRIPEMSLPGNPARRPFLNSKVLDISKHLFSTLRVYSDSKWEGSVIIKSDLNAYGHPEWKSGPHSFSMRQRRKLSKKSWRLAHMLPPKEYPVLTKISKVPGWVWNDSDLIVERFMPERENEEYCIRGWLFFGNQGYTYRLFSKDPVVKAGTSLRHEILGDPPVELEIFRKAQGWDFGKFDYVMVDGSPILLDINKTPTIMIGPDSPRLKYLASGIDGFSGVIHER